MIFNAVPIVIAPHMGGWGVMKGGGKTIMGTIR